MEKVKEIKERVEEPIKKQENKVQEQPEPKANPLDNLRYLDLNTLNVMQEHIYKSNKEAFDLYFTILNAIERNRLVGRQETK